MSATKAAIFVLAMGVLALARLEVDTEQAKQPQPPENVTLTNDNSTGYFTIDRETLASAPSILLVRVTDVFNPDKTGFHLLVYLSYQTNEHSGTGHSEAEKILIGDLGFFPPDRPASFELRASKAFEQLKATGSTPTNVRLLFQIRRLHEAQPWTTVKVIIAPTAWKTGVDH